MIDRWLSLLLLSLAVVTLAPWRWAGLAAAAGATVAAWTGVTVMTALHGFAFWHDDSYWPLWYPASEMWGFDIYVGHAANGPTPSANFYLTDALELLPTALTLIGLFATGYVAGIRIRAAEAGNL